MKALYSLLFLLSLTLSSAQAQPPRTPDELYGPLFEAVERSTIFPDSKTFVDCTPKEAPQRIVASYLQGRKSPSFSLKEFVYSHFNIPQPISLLQIASDTSIVAHINRLWPMLERRPQDEEVDGSSLLPLPYPYIVPGGRFREIYYWDSYFTMLGLKASRHIDMIENMVKNFAYLIQQYGHIPNGNRSYYLSRSQPPFFSLMVDLLAELKGDAVYIRYEAALQSEYDYWMDQSARTSHVIKMPDGSVLNRYYDQDNKPRQEMHREDVLLHDQTPNPDPNLYRDLRSAAESGWDFSSRWLGDGQNLSTIHTTDIVPVDLNCLLYHLEMTLSKAYGLSTRWLMMEEYRNRAALRQQGIEKYLWSAQDGFYQDYDLIQQRPTGVLSLAGVFPFYFGIAPKEHLPAVHEHILKDFLFPGGLVTTTRKTGQQWDAPNGWAPLQWTTIMGLEQYGDHQLAQDIAQRWLMLNTKVYRQTGKLLEKYNVQDTSLSAGGGEYPTQDGFGWTNGVYMGLEQVYNIAQ